MADYSIIEHFEVRNEDVTIRFTCSNYRRRIDECVSNLMVDTNDPVSCVKKQAFFGQTSDGVQFRKGTSFENDEEGWLKEDDISFLYP